MGIYITAAAVIGGQMEDYIHAFDRHAGDSGLPQVGLEQFDGPIGQLVSDIFQSATAQIICQANSGPPGHQGIDQV
jgi:hypothetical protein